MADLDTRRHDFHVAIENWQHDFNIGTIVRTANAFLAREVHIVGQATMEPSRRDGHRPLPARAAPPDASRTSPPHLHEQRVTLMGIDNLPGSEHLETWEMPRSVCFLFGQEGPGLSEQARERVRRHLLDRPVRLDALDQRLGGRRDRDAQLGGAVRRPRRRLAGLRVSACSRPAP